MREPHLLIGLISHWLFHVTTRLNGRANGLVWFVARDSLIGHLSGYRWQC